VALLVPPPEAPREPVFVLVPAPFVASMVVVLPPLALVRASLEPVTDEVPLPLDTDPVPVLTTAPIPAVEPFEP
jgi:hypothetical protein